MSIQPKEIHYQTRSGNEYSLLCLNVIRLVKSTHSIRRILSGNVIVPINEIVNLVSEDTTDGDSLSNPIRERTLSSLFERESRHFIDTKSLSHPSVERAHSTRSPEYDTSFTQVVDLVNECVPIAVPPAAAQTCLNDVVCWRIWLQT